MTSKENVSEVQTMHEVFLKLCVETKELHQSLKSLLPEDEMLKQDEWYETRMQYNNEIMQKVEE